MNHFFERFKGAQGGPFDSKEFKERLASMNDTDRAQFEEGMKQREQMFQSGFGRAFGRPGFGDADMQGSQREAEFKERLKNFSQSELTEFEKRLNKMLVLITDLKEAKTA